jgi:hypothetical protein
MGIRGTPLWYSGFASLHRATVDCLLLILSRRGSGQPARLSRRDRAVRAKWFYRLRLWRKLAILMIVCSPLLASCDAVNADEILNLRCNLSGTRLSDGRSKPYRDAVEFRVNFQTMEAWEVHPNRFVSTNHPRRITADIDEHAIRLSRGEDSDVRSSDISYRIDRIDGSIVFSRRVTWYYGQLSDDSLTLATGACEKASTIPYVEHLPIGDVHRFF